jgi:hypothetical protein
MVRELDSYSTGDYYYNYISDEPIKRISKNTYIEIINYANSLYKDFLLEGYTVNMGFGIGSLRIVRKKSDPAKPAINIVETMKARKKDPNALVYYTHDYYCFLKHFKPFNNSLFFRSHKFVAVRGVDSITKRLWLIMQTDEPALKQYDRNSIYAFSTYKKQPNKRELKLKLLWR